MQPEIFKTIEEFPQYEVSDYGNVKSWYHRFGERSRPKVLLLSKDHKGYYRVCLRKNGQSKWKFVHRLVLEAFIGPCPKGMQTCHNNGISDDNRLENLRWDTQESNSADKRKHGTAPLGENHPRAKLTNADVREIKRLISKKWYKTKIAKKFSVSRSTIYNIHERKNWAHLDSHLLDQEAP